MAKHQPTETQKPCRYCGKSIVWTRTLSHDWEHVLFCDNACKRQYNRENPPEESEDSNLKGPSTSRKSRRRTA